MPKNQRQQQGVHPITTSKATRAALAHGFRSGLEERISRQIEAAGVPVRFEEDKIKYIWPERSSTYTPDFTFNKKDGVFWVETKGRWTVEDRQKHLLIKEQHPDYDIRFVFSNQNAKLYKGSPTSYAQFCEKHGFQYAHKHIPDSWLEEARNDNEPPAAQE